jgi:hypothetical protein
LAVIARAVDMPFLMNLQLTTGLPKLSPEEAKQWQTSRTLAEADGTFFMTWPHHCAVWTKAF